MYNRRGRVNSWSKKIKEQLQISTHENILMKFIQKFPIILRHKITDKFIIAKELHYFKIEILLANHENYLNC